MSKVVTTQEVESRPCATCGEALQYEGPAKPDLEAADHEGGRMVCPNGHIDPDDSNS